MIITFQLALDAPLDPLQVITGDGRERLSLVTPLLWVIADLESLTSLFKETLPVYGHPLVCGTSSCAARTTDSGRSPLSGCSPLRQGRGAACPIQRDIYLRFVKLGRVLEKFEMALPVDGKELSHCTCHDLIQDFKLHLNFDMNSKYIMF